MIKPDPYEDLYKFEKMQDPQAAIVLKQFERSIVEEVDHIVEIAHGQHDQVKSEKDWVVVEELVGFWARIWPQEYREFKSAIPVIREAKGKGYSKSKEILHLGSIPPTLMKLIKAIFPLQEWNKEFCNSFVKRLPLFKVGE